MKSVLHLHLLIGISLYFTVNLVRNLSSMINKNDKDIIKDHGTDSNKRR